MIFNFKTTPYKHQLTALELSWDKENFALLMDMGTGKSKVLIDTITALYEHNKINSAVIFAPKGVYKNWGEQEIPEHLPFDIAKQTKIAYRSAPLTETRKNSIREIFKPVEK